MNQKDPLGERMKRQYEDRARFTLPRRTYTILRCDGKAFHTFTSKMMKPYDTTLVFCMTHAARALCQAAQGSCFAYVQSDEISVLLQDFSTITTDAWFDGNLQKMVSVSASVVTAAFNSMLDIDEPALFDCRAFTIPDPVEVENYFIWRQQDAVRNSIQGLAQVHFSHKQLHGLSCDQLQEKLFQEKQINWNDVSIPQKRGIVIAYEPANEALDFRGRWYDDHEIPVFTKRREYLTSRIPRYDSPVTI